MTAQEILGEEEYESLKEELDILMRGDFDYDDVEQLFLGYGLEMDYFEEFMY